MKFPKYAHSFEVIADLPPALEGLKRLSTNLFWSWRPETVALFKEVDRHLWEEVEHNPVQLLNRVSAERLDRLSKDESFQTQLQASLTALDRYLADKTWFQAQRGSVETEQIAYFCAEFGISEALPIYSGGLGILAGDHLKAASDLGLPLVGVGLLYSRGYFRQSLTHDGWQQEDYPQYDFYKLPLQLARNENQQPIRVSIELPDRMITCQIWTAIVGRIKLVLLDSNVLENAPTDQGITDTLYGGDQEMRIRQEIILGVGGMRALKALGIQPKVCHMNEGHAAFLTLERIRQTMADHGCDYRTARKLVVSSNVFTTHTPVPAGFDLFPSELLQKYVPKLIEPLGVSFEDFVKDGRIEPENTAEPFNMAVYAMSNANFVNGVSKLHAQVTREMFHAKWPDYPESEVPVDAVTNGIHTATWIHPKIADLYDQYLGSLWRDEPFNPDAWADVSKIPDDELWEVIENLRGELVRYARRRMRRQMSKRGASQMELSACDAMLDPRVLTIGFARRFATYKRASLMLSDRERLKSLLFHSERPIQIVIAGKSHPKDDGGKTLIQDLVRFAGEEGVRNRMVFLEDYDMDVAKHLVQGVDVWLNNPRRPYEASGTSGMKVVPNGGLNCSILDGWWDEGYAPEVGWAIGDRRNFADYGQQDWLDSHSFYHLIESEITSKFYHRSNGSSPAAWMQMVKASIRNLAPVFSTGRMVSEYASRFYFPAWDAHERLSADGLTRAKSALAWRDKARSEFPKVVIRSVTHSASGQNRIGNSINIRAEITLGALSPDEVRVHAVVGQIGANRDLIEGEPVRLFPVEGTSHVFEGTLQLNEPGHRGFIVRVEPYHEDVSIPGELNLVRWES